MWMFSTALDGLESLTLASDFCVDHHTQSGVRGSRVAIDCRHHIPSQIVVSQTRSSTAGAGKTYIA
jgi:hypothetical protein